jgi:hypothetical protein
MVVMSMGRKYSHNQGTFMVVGLPVMLSDLLKGYQEVGVGSRRQRVVGYMICPLFPFY